MASSAPRIAILGGGPSGLAACKAALEEGLQPTVFEQAAGVGGLWRSDGAGKVWNAMRTNLSKFTCAFSDDPWPGEAPDFPSAMEVQAYLEQYASKHGLRQHVQLHSRVTSLELLAAGGWQVSWQTGADEGQQHRSEAFSYVIVASGIFARPQRLALPGMETFSGELIHAADYREPARFAGRRVLVVGAAFSGADLAVNLAGVAASVTVATRRPLWYLPRYVKSKPVDLLFYSRAAADRSRGASEEERNRNRHAFFASIVGDLPRPLAAPDPSRGDLPFVAITDTFLDAVRAGSVVARPTEVVAFEGQAAVFADGKREEFDAAILATGYCLELDFLAAPQRQALELDPEDLLQPAILHECVWRPELPGLAFVGIYRGPYFAVMELQARWACGVFSGRLPAPTAAELEAGLEAERSVRRQRPRPQFPHGDYVGMVESLAHRVGVHPAEILASESDDLRPLLHDGPLLPFHYRLVGFGARRAVAEAAIRECAAKYPLASL